VLESSAGVESLGAGKRAKTNLVALTKLHVTSEHLESLFSKLIARVDDPAVGLHQHSGTKVVLGVPPVRGAGTLAAGTQHALVEAIQKFALFNRLKVFFGLEVSSKLFTLQEWVNALVLSVEMGHVNHKVFQNKHKHKWGNH